MLKTQTPSIHNFLSVAIKEINIDSNREELLKRVAAKMVEEITSNNKVSLNFICTHNSRRSQISQTWGFYIANILNLPVQCLSGGTEVTAFHRNSVNTLKDAGFKFNITEFSHQNPVYEIEAKGVNEKLVGFSKTYDHYINQNPYIAITTCNSADQNCPFIPEAIARFHVPYIDPKYADNTEEQDEAYMKTNKIIAAELNFLFSEVKNRLNR